MSRPPTRWISLAVVWAASVVAATVVGMTAVGAIGSGIVDSGQAPLSAEEVDARLTAASGAAAPTGVPAGPTATPTPTPTTAPTTPTTAPPAAVVTDVVASAGGTAVARCTGGVVEVLSVSPAQGYGVHDSDDPARVRFESDGGRVEVRISCVDGRPVGTVRGGGGRGGGDG